MAEGPFECYIYPFGRGNGQVEMMEQPIIHPEGLARGMIGWITTREKLGRDLQCSRPGHCNHKVFRGPLPGIPRGDVGDFARPCVVLDYFQRPNSSEVGDLMCVVAAATTFEGKASLQTYLMNQHLTKFWESIPIRFPDPNRPYDNRFPHLLQLDLAVGRLREQTYIKVQHYYTLPVSCLWSVRWRRGHIQDIRLTKESYDTLMYCFELAPKEYEDVQWLERVGITRLVALRDAEMERIREEMRLPNLARTRDNALEDLKEQGNQIWNSNDIVRHVAR